MQLNDNRFELKYYQACPRHADVYFNNKLLAQIYVASDRKNNQFNKRLDWKQTH